MTAVLADYRLVFVGPAKGQTAVGDYSESFVAAVRPYFADVVECRTASPGADSVADIRRKRQVVRRLVDSGAPGRVLVHAELAGGGLVPFWTTAGLPGIPVTATVHDPPQGIWWPARTRFMANHRLIFHAIHYPMRPVSRALEGVVNGRRTLFALTETGRRSIEQTYPRTRAVYVPHIVADRPTIRPAQDRPRAVGFFGHVYRGKGFEQIARVRQALPDDVGIRVAGRGTESLPRMDGIEIVGAVDGRAEDDFFESVRAIVAPYGKRHFYAETYPASGVVAHATAYRTPVVCTDYGSLAELDDKVGALLVRCGLARPDVVASELAAAISSLVENRALLTELGEYAEKTRQARSAPHIAESFAAAWADMLTERSEGA
jgi:glycosyltransferase involved in cell wall biosynthesis